MDIPSLVYEDPLKNKTRMLLKLMSKGLSDLNIGIIPINLSFVCMIGVSSSSALLMEQQDDELERRARRRSRVMDLQRKNMGSPSSPADRSVHWLLVYTLGVINHNLTFIVSKSRDCETCRIVLWLPPIFLQEWMNFFYE